MDCAQEITPRIGMVLEPCSTSEEEIRKVVEKNSVCINLSRVKS